MDLKNLVSRDGSVQPTNLSRKLIVNGISKAYQVYRIRLDLLRYNPQNDRISTYISQYKAENGGHLPDESDVEAYNKIIEGFICSSNPDRIKQTTNNIRTFGQQQPGVVLSNGLVIDGNRRFTCLRHLAEEDAKYDWIEAVILDAEVGDDVKAIKMLELSIQHGEEEKVDYNPIDRLVGVYNDIIHNHLLTPEEYAKSSNVHVKEIRKMMDQAKYMVEFLEFINAEQQFYIARDLNIAGSLAEMPGILKACSSPEDEEIVKGCVYANLVMEPAGDTTRFVRKFKKILKSDAAKDFVKEQQKLAEEVSDKLEGIEQVTPRSIRNQVRSDQDLVERMRSSMENAELASKRVALLKTPVDNIKKSRDLLDEVDDAILDHLEDDARAEAIRALNAIEDRVEQIRSFVNGEED